jgi:hypothetical protein
MGSNHPISLRLKKNYVWEGTIYKFQKKINYDYIILQKTLIKIIHHYFQYQLISKPKFYYTPKGIRIVIGYYQISSSPSWGGKLKNSPFGQLINNTTEINDLQLKKNLVLFENLIKKALIKNITIPIKLQLIRFKNPLSNSQILARLISILLRKYNISAIWRILLKKIKLKNQGFRPNKKIMGPLWGYYFDWNRIFKDTFFSKEFYSYINGLKLKISGRPSKRRGTSRTKVKIYSIGNFKFNSINSLISYGHIERKDKNGSQSIKVYTSTIVINSAKPTFE